MGVIRSRYQVEVRRGEERRGGGRAGGPEEVVSRDNKAAQEEGILSRKTRPRMVSMEDVVVEEDGIRGEEDETEELKRVGGLKEKRV